ncbi:hypothetical protein BTO20_00350 [Mycobacterium dioxanotrophicus]|uniref:Uncharacterized protein n=1 Tax=Mycobacterium dioxanotrophicus TaxID=482462 RepID=A0A1Y0BWJ8_9MYCO|nr:hypothetical protein BTO20_00350 [Mycobacterium dioxanotrophicus]
MSPTYLTLVVAALDVTTKQVRNLLVGRIRCGGLHPVVAGDPGDTHHPRHPLVVDPPDIGHAVVELGGQLGGLVSGYSRLPAATHRQQSQ